jgi:hypothetical protein
VNGDAEQRLIDKLRKIEALFARPTTPGERGAAASARERIRQRLDHLGASEHVEEYKFAMADDWSRSLFVALLRRYGLKPYRYRRQRYTTVMVQVTASFVDDVLWPEFQELDRTLRAHLDSVTKRIIHEAIHSDGSAVEERGGELAAAAQGRR